MIIKKQDRILRFSREFKRNVAIILQNYVSDNRVGIVTVSGVSVSRDLSYVKIFVTFLDKNKRMEVQSRIYVLQSAVGFIRFLLGKLMCLRNIPKIVFFYDYSLLEGIRICDLINQALVHDEELYNKNNV